MGIEPLTAGLNALDSLKIGDIALDLMNPSVREQINHEYALAQMDMQEFCQAVLRGDAAAVNLLIGGLRHDGPLPKLTPGEARQLAGIIPGIDGSTLVRLYILGREGDFAARCRDILMINSQEAKQS